MHKASRCQAVQCQHEHSDQVRMGGNVVKGSPLLAAARGAECKQADCEKKSGVKHWTTHPWVTKPLTHINTQVDVLAGAYCASLRLTLLHVVEDTSHRLPNAEDLWPGLARYPGPSAVAAAGPAPDAGGRSSGKSDCSSFCTSATIRLQHRKQKHAQPVTRVLGSTVNRYGWIGKPYALGDPNYAPSQLWNSACTHWSPQQLTHSTNIAVTAGLPPPLLIILQSAAC